jgi:hypothetical protein
MEKKDKFEVICRYKDVKPSNVNEIFESYGCSTLEARVPIVDNNVAEKVKNANSDQQRYDTLALKSESGSNAVEGRIPRTKDRQLSLVELGRGEVVIAAGKQREKSPVDRGELDEELEEYMRKTAEIKAARMKAREEIRERALVLPDVPMIQHNNDPDWD